MGIRDVDVAMFTMYKILWVGILYIEMAWMLHISLLVRAHTSHDSFGCGSQFGVL